MISEMITNHRDIALVIFIFGIPVIGIILSIIKASGNMPAWVDNLIDTIFIVSVIGIVCILIIGLMKSKKTT